MPQPVQQTALIILPRDVARQLKATVQAQSVEQNVMDVLNTRVRGAVGIKPAPQPAHVAPVSPSPATSDDGDSDGGDASDLPAVRGTWAQMPGGFYVRHLPEGWSRTRIEIMVPDAALAKADLKHPLTFDPTQYLAILSQAPAQRLGITLRAVATAKHGGGLEHKDMEEALFRPVVNNRTGRLDRHLDPGSIYRNIVMKYAKATGISGEAIGVCVHSMRATAATNALSNAADIAKVQEWLGHANVSTTRLYDRRKTRPDDSPTFHVKY